MDWIFTFHAKGVSMTCLPRDALYCTARYSVLP